MIPSAPSRTCSSKHFLILAGVVLTQYIVDGTIGYSSVTS